MSVDRSIPSQDLYGELEVDAGASTEAIEGAYRTLMKRHHPDRAGPDGLARAKRLNVARDWLVDPERRARYDAAHGTKRVETLGPTARSPAPEDAPGSSRSSMHRPSATKADHAHPRSPVDRSPIGTAAALGLGIVAVVAVVSAALVFGGGSLAAFRSVSPLPGTLGEATAAPSIEPTLSPTPAPAATPTPAPTPAPTPRATPGSTPAPAAVPTGHADIRFSGMYAEHYDEPLGGASACTTTTARGGSVPALTGFDIDSGVRSGSRWQLTLADLTVSWSMDIFFEDTADGLWWNSGVGVGSVTRTADGFAFDVVLTDSAQSLHARGTVICR